MERNCLLTTEEARVPVTVSPHTLGRYRRVAPEGWNEESRVNVDRGDCQVLSGDVDLIRAVPDLTQTTIQSNRPRN